MTSSISDTLSFLRVNAAEALRTFSAHALTNAFRVVGLGNQLLATGLLDYPRDNAAATTSVYLAPEEFLLTDFIVRPTLVIPDSGESVVVRAGRTSGGSQIMLDETIDDTTTTAEVFGTLVAKYGADRTVDTNYKPLYAAGTTIYVRITPSATLRGGQFRWFALGIRVPMKVP